MRRANAYNGCPSAVVPAPPRPCPPEGSGRRRNACSACSGQAHVGAQWTAELMDDGTCIGALAPCALRSRACSQPTPPFPRRTWPYFAEPLSTRPCSPGTGAHRRSSALGLHCLRLSSCWRLCCPANLRSRHPVGRNATVTLSHRAHPCLLDTRGLSRRQFTCRS